MNYFLLKLIMFYRKYLSPLKRPCCRFYPTCSDYSVQAITKYGAGKGGWMALKRIVRCNPLSKGGYDPVELRPRPTVSERAK